MERVAEQASAVQSAAGEQAGEIATQARDHASEVAHDAMAQGREVLDRAKTALHEQADIRTNEVSQGLRRLSAEVDALAEGRPQDAGPVADYVRQIGTRVRQAADRVDDVGFDGIVQDVSDFGRRRPGVFLLAAGAAGFVAGRAIRAGRQGSGTGPGQVQHGYPAAPPAATFPASGYPPAEYPSAEHPPAEYPPTVPMEAGR
jgi:hypothetical protein